MKRKILSLALSLLMILSVCGTCFVSAAKAYAFVKDGDAFTFDGATYQKYKITSGEVDANNKAITVDATVLEFNPADGLIPMAFSCYSGTSAVLKTQYEMAVNKYGYDVVGVINGSFFTMDSGTPQYGNYGTLVGDLISDGKVASAHAGFSGSVVAFGTDGSMNVVDSSLSYDLTIDGKTVPSGLYYINKTSGSKVESAWKDGVYYYDVSCGRVCDTYEICPGYEVVCRKLDHTDLIVGGVLKAEVVEVRENAYGGALADEKYDYSDKFILFVKTSSPNAAFVKDLEAGASVEISVEETVAASKEIMEKANSVITNVGVLVKDGVDLTQKESSIGTHDVTLMARWTAFGIKADGSYVFFTSDSVQNEAEYSTGKSYCVTLRDVAKAMIELGCTDVIRMDGGGSSAMYLKDDGTGAPGYVMSSNRSVGDCILVVKRSSMNKDATVKEDLTALVESLKNNDKASYAETVAEAKEVLEAASSTSADYIRAYAALNGVVSAYKSLADGLDEAKSAKKDDYSPTIWAQLQELIELAEVAKDSKEISAAQVVMLASNLNKTINSTGAYSVVVSKGCTYTHGTTPDATSYPDTGNKELTDGDYSIDTDGKAPGWVGFSGGKGAKVTIDLGSVCNDLSTFKCRALKITGWGIPFPNTMTIEVSEDGSSFTKLGTASLTAEQKENNSADFVLNLEKGVSARYVRFTVAGTGWTFLSEMEVIRNELPYKDIEPEFAMGDINGDNILNAFDYQMVKAFVLGSFTTATEAQIERMDVIADGTINAFDYQRVKYVVLNGLTL